MKVHIEIDCTPEEARSFMGLPDVGKANEVYVDLMAKAMKGVGSIDKLRDLREGGGRFSPVASCREPQTGPSDGSPDARRPFPSAASLRDAPGNHSEDDGRSGRASAEGSRSAGSTGAGRAAGTRDGRQRRAHDRPKVTMAGIASAAGTLLRQDVYDETGLKGFYDLDLRWTAPSVPNAPPPSERLGPDGMKLTAPISALTFPR